jgi:hypothetical protein
VRKIELYEATGMTKLERKEMPYLFDHMLAKDGRSVPEYVCEGWEEDAKIFGVVHVPKLLYRLPKFRCYRELRRQGSKSDSVQETKTRETSQERIRASLSS